MSIKSIGYQKNIGFWDTFMEIDIANLTGKLLEVPPFIYQIYLNQLTYLFVFVFVLLGPSRKKVNDRKDLMKDFTKIYEWRSSVVHNGKLPQKKIEKNKKRPYT